jgi:hypothetical protein
MTTSLKNSFIIRDFVSGYRRADLSSNLIMASWTMHYAYLWDIVNDYGSSWTVKACSHFSVVYFSFWSCLLPYYIVSLQQYQVNATPSMHYHKIV